MIDGSEGNQSRPVGGPMVPAGRRDLASVLFPEEGDFLPAAPAVAPSGAGASPQQILIRMLRYKWTFVLVFLLIVGVSIPAIWTLVVPMYRAKAVVRVSPRINRLVFKTDENGMIPLYTSYLNTQVAMIQHPEILNRVVDPQIHPEIAETAWYQDDGAGFLRPPMDPVSRLKEVLRVSPVRKTELIDVSVTAKDKRDAMLLVNAVVDEYEVRDRDLMGETEQMKIEALAKRRNKLRGEIETELQYQAKLMEDELLPVNSEELLNGYFARINELDMQWRDLERKIKVDAWQIDQLAKTSEEGQEESSGDAGADETAFEISPEDLQFASDPKWQQLKDAVDTSLHQLALGHDRFGDSHPQMQRIKADVRFAQARLAEYEEQLRQRLALGGPISPETAGPAPVTLESMELAHQRDREEAQLLKGDIEEERGEARRKSRKAQEIANRELEIKRKQENLQRIQERIDALDVESNNPLGRISVVRAVLPRHPSSDRRWMMTAMALFGAIGAGLGLAFLRAFLDTSLRRADEVTSTVRVPFLGQLPKISPSAVLDSMDDRLLEALRMVRTALLERVPQGKGCSVLITSPTPQAGKTSLTLLLAKSMAMLGKRVLLVDTDLRRSSLTGRLGLDDEPGLTAVLHGQTRWEQVVVGSQIPGVDVIPVGRSLTSEDPELMANGVFQGCLKQWKKAYDFIFFDSPPVLPVADARILAGQVDGTVLALRASHSRRHEATECLARLGAAGAKLFGTVLVGAEVRPSRYGGYGYYYYSSTRPELLESNP
jgi:capsular exopolysaccharide synthesis family protein